MVPKAAMWFSVAWWMKGSKPYPSGKRTTAAERKTNNALTARAMPIRCARPKSKTADRAVAERPKNRKVLDGTVSQTDRTASCVAEAWRSARVARRKKTPQTARIQNRHANGWRADGERGTLDGSSFFRWDEKRAVTPMLRRTPNIAFQLVIVPV